MVRRTRQRAGRHHQEALGPGDRLIRLELFRRHEPIDGGVFARRLQVLADGDEVDAGGPHVVHHLHDLFLGLAQADHDAGLGELVRVPLLDHLQQAQAVEVARARPDLQIQARHGLEVVIEDVGLGVDHHGRRPVLSQEVGRQDLDGGVRRLDADLAHHLGEVGRTAVGHIVAVDRGDDDVVQTHLLDGQAHLARLFRIQRLRQARLDVAEGAGPRAGVAHDHQGGVLLAPALADVRAGRLFTHRHQPLGANDLLGGVVLTRARRLDPQPVRLF